MLQNSFVLFVDNTH